MCGFDELLSKTKKSKLVNSEIDPVTCPDSNDDIDDEEEFSNYVHDSEIKRYAKIFLKHEKTRLSEVVEYPIYLSNINKMLKSDFESKFYNYDDMCLPSRTKQLNVKMMEAADHMTIWAILHARQSMALHFLQLSSHPFNLAIFAASLNRKISNSVPDYDTKSSTIYAEYANEFENIATEMLKCYESHDKDMTLAMLTEYKPHWQVSTTMLAAANSKSYELISSNAFQTLITKEWNNGLHCKLIWLMLASFFPCILNLKYFKFQKSITSIIESLENRVPDELKNGNQKSDYNKIINNNDLQNKSLEFSEKVKTMYFSPRCKFTLHMVTMAVFLLILSITLLFGLYVDSFSAWEIITVIFCVSWMMEHLLICLVQHNVYQSTFKRIFQAVPTLSLYLLTDAIFLAALFCRIKKEQTFIPATYLYSVLLIMNYVKFIYLLMVSEYYGPKVVMIEKMVVKFFDYVIILFVILVGYGAAVQVLLYPTNDKFNANIFFSIFYYPYFQLFGEMAFEYYNAKEECNSTLQECPTPNQLIPILHVIYMLIAALIFLNLLIAVFSNIFANMVNQSNQIWTMNRYRIVFYFKQRSVIPQPFAVVGNAYFFVKEIWRFCKACTTKNRQDETNRNQMQVDTNYIDKELGLTAFLHGFQKYYGHEYFKTVQCNESKRLGSTVNEVNETIMKLQKKHVDFLQRNTKKYASININSSSPWSERLKFFQNIIESANSQTETLLESVKQMQVQKT